MNEATCEEMLALMLMRMTVDPGDYDRDGVVELTLGGSCFGCGIASVFNPCGEDWVKFMTDAESSFNGTNIVPYADWNFSGGWDGHVGPPGVQNPNNFGVDFAKFFTGALGGCP